MTNSIYVAFESSPETFSVVHFSVHERVSSPFDAEVVARISNTDIDLAALSGSNAKLLVNDGSGAGHTRTYHGVCLSVEQLQPAPDGLSTYGIHIAPRLALLAHRNNYRVFQHETVKGIVKTILDEWDVAHDWRIDTAAHPQFEYRVQYDETDLAFVSRLLEVAGISYYFEHTSESSLLVLDDSPEQGDMRSSPLPYAANPSERAMEATVSEVRLAHAVRRGRHRIRDLDFRRPARFELACEATGGSELEQRLEDYRYQPGAFTTEGHAAGNTPAADDLGVARSSMDHGSRLAAIGLAHHRGGRRRVTFTTTAFDVYAGSRFQLVGHPRAELSQPLLVLEMTVYGAPEDVLHFSASAVFADEPYRCPIVTPVPKIHGVESAIVVGPGSDEIHTDEYGRVRVQFHWDRHGRHDERSSCWLRVSQGWAGAGFGLVALPRVGHEVLVSFLGGDPDQPVVSGRLFNASNPVPYSLPQNKTISTWRTRSTPNSSGFNELRFEDKAGEEEVFIHAERDLNEIVEHDHHAVVKHDEGHRIGNNQSFEVRRNQTTSVGGSRSVSVGGSESHSIGAQHTMSIGGDESYTIKGMRSHKIEKDDELMVTDGGRYVTVAQGDFHVKVPNGEILHRAGKAKIGMRDGLIIIDTGHGAMIHLSQDNIVLIGAQIELRARRAIRLNATNNIQGQANRVMFNGSTITQINGGVVHLNCGPVTTGLGDDVDDLVNASPTLQAQIAQLQADGWDITYGPPGSGSATNPATHRITVDGAQRGNPEAVTQTLAHEAGHAVHPQEPVVPMEGNTRQEYVDGNTQRELRSEGAATLNNGRVREELNDTTGRDIGMAGSRPDDYQGVYERQRDGDITERQAQDEIGDIYRQHETTSNSHQNYGDYYSGWYGNEWDRTHGGTP